MTTIIIDIPDEIKQKLGLADKESYDSFIIKTIGGEYISPDLQFTSYEEMSEEHRVEYDKLKYIDKAKLLNI